MNKGQEQFYLFILDCVPKDKEEIFSILKPELKKRLASHRAKNRRAAKRTRSAEVHTHTKPKGARRGAPQPG